MTESPEIGKSLAVRPARRGSARRFLALYDRQPRRYTLRLDFDRRRDRTLQVRRFAPARTDDHRSGRRAERSDYNKLQPAQPANQLCTLLSLTVAASTASNREWKLTWTIAKPRRAKA